ncbi:CocE/NonD family hydrolase [Nocardia rhizosphaerihabitans]|uniref:CocE/NonD family hydrolase n=1 Tax=Nocardia rhizosphaerihabitans TaxID=1691570 RepID=UPI00366CAD35
MTESQPNGLSLSRRRLIQTSALAAFGAILLPRIVACAQDTPASILRLDLDGAADLPHQLGGLESVSAPMRDGVKLALDIVRPAGDGVDTKRDTILVMGRYWRGVKGEAFNSWAETLVPHGYAVVVGDVRGTGASFGQWPYHRSRGETRDFSDVLDWIAKQPWSTGSVVGYGLSYTANTSDWMAERNHPALKGIIPRFADYDPYDELYFPGGVPNGSYGARWGNRVKDLDRNVLVDVNGIRKPSPGVRPVGPDGETQLAAALQEHERVPSVWEGLQHVAFKDDRPRPGVEPRCWTGASWRPPIGSRSRAHRSRTGRAGSTLAPRRAQCAASSGSRIR